MRLISFIVSLALLSCFTSINAQAKNIYGLYEQVYFQELGNVAIQAKLDTGALTTSFSATDISLFNKDGKQWVRFRPQIKGSDFPIIEKPLIRFSKIKTRHDDVRNEDDLLHSRRPVVMMNVCFDGNMHQIEVNLTDRSRFNYPLLLGRSALVQFKAIINPSLRYRAKSVCSL